MADIDCAKAASVTWDAWYECVFMLFSICDAPAMSEQMTDTVMRVLKWKTCLCYLPRWYCCIFCPHLCESQRRSSAPHCKGRVERLALDEGQGESCVTLPVCCGCCMVVFTPSLLHCTAGIHPGRGTARPHALVCGTNLRESFPLRH